jgi:transposase-like protein
MIVTIAGKKHYLLRAVDRDGVVLDALVQRRCGALANAIGGTRRRPSVCCASS